jgi:hypothetical protein
MSAIDALLEMGDGNEYSQAGNGVHGIRTQAARGKPARHGPKTAPATTSLVTGFALTGPDVPTIYVSGDNSTSIPGGHHEHL